MKDHVVTYEARDIGYGREYGTVRGVWDDDVDGFGKRPLRVIEWLDASGVDASESILVGACVLYLFEDEIISDEEVDAR